MQPHRAPSSSDKKAPESLYIAHPESVGAFKDWVYCKKATSDSRNTSRKQMNEEKLNIKGDASCHHNHIYKTKLESVRPIFRTLNTIPEHILCSLKVPILGQFQPFQPFVHPNYGGRIQPALGTEFVYPIYYWQFDVRSGIGCAHFTIYSVIQMAPTDSGK